MACRTRAESAGSSFSGPLKPHRQQVKGNLHETVGIIEQILLEQTRSNDAVARHIAWSKTSEQEGLERPTTDDAFETIFTMIADHTNALRAIGEILDGLVENLPYDFERATGERAT